MRKTKDVVITADNRDRGKIFTLKEMSAYDADRWANRALLALMNHGAELPDNAATAGLAGLAAAGIHALAKLPAETVQPLLDELLVKCVTYQHSPKVPPQAIFLNDACQIEEIPTFWTLRIAVLELHTDFLSAALLPTTA